MNRKLLALAATALTLVGSSAMAADRADAHVIVKYGDLNLAADAGVATLYARLRGAARAVCGDPGRAALRVMQDAERCRARAIDSAVRQIGSPGLAALHERTNDARFAQLERSVRS